MHTKKLIRTYIRRDPLLERWTLCGPLLLGFIYFAGYLRRVVCPFGREHKRWTAARKVHYSQYWTTVLSRLALDLNLGATGLLGNSPSLANHFIEWVYCNYYCKAIEKVSKLELRVILLNFYSSGELYNSKNIKESPRIQARSYQGYPTI